MWIIRRELHVSLLQHTVGSSSGPLYFATGTRDLGPIDLNTTKKCFRRASAGLKRVSLIGTTNTIGHSKIKMNGQRIWGYTYSEVFLSIKDCLGMLLSKTSKAEFAPYLIFLGEYVENDSLFPKVETGLVTKWQKT